MSLPVGAGSSHTHLESFRRGTKDYDVFNGAVEGCGGGGLVPQVADMPLTSPGLIDMDRTTRVDDAVAAADWLDIAEAMMDADDEKSPALRY